MGDVHLTAAGWKKAKVEAHQDPNFKKGASGIEKQVGKVEAQLKAKNYVKALPELNKLRKECAKSLVDASKQQKNKGKGADQKTYIAYTRYLNEMVEEIDRKLKIINEGLEVDTKSKRKRQPKDLKLADILKSSKMLLVFRAFCKFAKQEPECEFVKDVLVGKNKPSQKLYDRYFKPNAPFEVNVATEMKQPWRTAAEDGSANAWKAVDVRPVLAEAMKMLEENPLKSLREGDGKPALQQWVDQICNV